MHSHEIDEKETFSNFSKLSKQQMRAQPDVVLIGRQTFLLDTFSKLFSLFRPTAFSFWTEMNNNSGKRYTFNYSSTLTYSTVSLEKCYPVKLASPNGAPIIAQLPRWKTCSQNCRIVIISRYLFKISRSGDSSKKVFVQAATIDQTITEGKSRISSFPCVSWSPHVGTNSPCFLSCFQHVKS